MSDAIDLQRITTLYRKWEQGQNRPCRCGFGSAINLQSFGLSRMQESCKAYQILPPDSLLVSSSDLQPGRGQRLDYPEWNCPTMIAIVMLSPGVSTSLSAREMTCQLCSVLKSFYSPAQTFLYPGSLSNWAVMMASNFCERKYE